jgi:hypothetical protein
MTSTATEANTTSESDALQDALLGLPDEELPAYSGPSRTSRPTTQHAYHLQKDGRTWLTLNLASRALSEKHIPTFIGPSTITGSVQLDLAKPEHLLAIELTVCFTSL